MKRTFILLVALVILVIGAAQAYGPVVSNLTNTYAPTQYLQLSTTATDMGGFWRWAYEVTPLAGATGIGAFQINLGLTEANMILAIPQVEDIAGPVIKPEWYYTYFNKGYVRWVDKFGNSPLNAGSTYRFVFDHPWGPVEGHTASAIGANGYTGEAWGPAQPAIPEPSTFILGALGLSSMIGGFRLRKKI